MRGVGDGSKGILRGSLIVAVNRQNPSQKQDGYGAISSSYGPAEGGDGVISLSPIGDPFGNPNPK
jgi:hypothetical protein